MRLLRSWIYLMVGLVLLALALTGSYAWATPEQAPDAQGTVPTARPRITSVPPTPIITVAPNPTTAPGGGVAPMVTATEPPATPQPAATGLPPVTDATATALPANALPGSLGLTINGDRPIGWPGLTMQFTATLRNAGAVTLVQPTLDLYLADGLAAVPQAAGAPGTWSGRTLHAAVDDLAVGGQVAVPFRVTILKTATPGSVQQIMGIARAAGGYQVVVQTLIPLPPAELPTTGERLGD
ncbi:MAG TPA: hypothetical protein VGA61_06745 [Anaerolineae bacterium]